MKAISDYTIYCTEEQTKKALELGAPIDKGFGRTIVYDNMEYLIPTAEQMLGWLEEQGISLYIVFIPECKKYKWYFNHKYEEHRTRKEVTLAAIDAALEYLSKHKK